MSQPFDLDAAVGEAIGEPFRFTWGAQDFEVLPMQARDIEDQIRLIEVIEANGNFDKDPKALLDVLGLAIGRDVLAAMRKARPVGGAAVTQLIQAWMTHEGVALGKSPVSSRSSASTAPRSKSTSRSGRARKTN